MSVLVLTAISRRYCALALGVLAWTTVRPGTARAQIPVDTGTRPVARDTAARADSAVVVAPRAALRPRATTLVLRSIGGATALSVTGALLGFAIDARNCRPNSGSFLDFCLDHAGEGTAIGWFGGAAAAATFIAVAAARRRGCPARSAWLRAASAAGAGVLPGVLVALSRPKRYPSNVTAVLMSAPVLAGGAAAAAVIGCHR